LTTSTTSRLIVVATLAATSAAIGEGSTRDRLVEAATQLLDQGGPAAVTLREVGRLAGVSHNAPYKHVTGKEELLAAVAARELRRLHDATLRLSAEPTPPGEGLRSMMHGYVAWATRYPARFKLVFGSWSTESAELAEAAAAARVSLIATVTRAQAAGDLPNDDPERTAALLQAAAHGAADLALAGHLARDGKGRAAPTDLVDDLLRHLQAAAPR
jgi:AcrR family transcriptional regulator